MVKFYNLWIAIPDSSISDEQTKRDKSIKVSQFARACSIFRVNKIYIYHDKTSRIDNKDNDILKTILRYLDTPQYLRRTLYPHMPQLQYAGILHPIKAPHHKKFENIKRIKMGEVRVGVFVKLKGTNYVDIGLDALVPYEGNDRTVGEKLNVRIVSSYPDLKAKEATAGDFKNHYWGYEVKEVPNLRELLQETKKTKIIITSRNGSNFQSKENKLINHLNDISNLLVVFGAPKKGVDEILASEGQSIRQFDFVVNMFPFQGTETVRLEEAILGTLSILNYVIFK
ncbi:MAG TPA: RNA methyltransferase [Nitrososphaeraceae archaeon]|jgi:methyltransferase|nr:RNA methyltransferase [Nitrososphaeraceae archaeon]